MSQTNDYIFISYAHKDADEILPVIRFLQDNGYKVWYDEGIEAGTEWPEYIAQRIKNCAVFIAFISPNAISSNNCRNEINYAVSLQKQFLAVYLRETVMTAGMELQLGSIQAMFKYRHETEESFLSALKDANILQQLRGDIPFAKTVVSPMPVAPNKKTMPPDEKQIKTKRTTACKWILALVCLLALVGSSALTYILTPFYDGLAQGALITTALVAATAVPLTITVTIVKNIDAKYPVKEQKQIYEDTFSCVLIFWFFATVLDCFFIRSTSVVIWKILISLGINLLRYFIPLLCTPDDPQK